MTSLATTSKSTSTRPPYPAGVPGKFSADGQVHRYPGNTTVCHIPLNSPLLPDLRAVYAGLSSHSTLSEKMHLLPPESWHMTTLEGVLEKKRDPGTWPPGKEQQPLAECTTEFAHRLRQLGLELEKEGLAPPYQMRVRGFDKCLVGIGIAIEGATVEEEERIRKLRDRLADALGFRTRNHETYNLHISMAYLLRYIEGEDRQELNKVLAQYLPGIQKEFELGAVEFCTFEDMHYFSRLFYLGEK